MYHSFAIKNFRCFSDIDMEGFERVNLITGKNNVGKTALIEALWLYHGYQNPILGVTIDKFRGLETFRKDDFLRNIFSDFDIDRQIALSAKDRVGQQSTLRIPAYEANETYELTTKFGDISSQFQCRQNS